MVQLDANNGKCFKSSSLEATHPDIMSNEQFQGDYTNFSYDNGGNEDQPGALNRPTISEQFQGGYTDYSYDNDGNGAQPSQPGTLRQPTITGPEMSNEQFQGDYTNYSYYNGGNELQPSSAGLDQIEEVKLYYISSSLLSPINCHIAWRKSLQRM